MTGAETTIIAGLEIPSTSPVFLSIVGVHVAAGSACVISGAVAILSPKRAGRHPTFGSIYYWCLVIVSATATALAVVRWDDDYHLFILGLLALAAGSIGRLARRQLWRSWAMLHIAGMGLSYILLLAAFYVDNGKSLPLWNRLPSILYWLIPAAVGLPILFHAMLRHPVIQNERRAARRPDMVRNIDVR